ncbi:hypothetical protein F4776DRAFT_606922 [Hypoxylon sp. NC0597]|nr:hypothetical protein F4776DRAFT_606922 [Hypoxylon sp. NC0597]
MNLKFKKNQAMGRFTSSLLACLSIGMGSRPPSKSCPAPSIEMCLINGLDSLEPYISGRYCRHDAIIEPIPPNTVLSLGPLANSFQCASSLRCRVAKPS